MRPNTNAASSSLGFKEFGRFSGRAATGRLPIVLEERRAGQGGTFAGEDMDKVSKKGIDKLQLPLNYFEEASKTVLTHPKQLLAHTLSSNNLDARKVFALSTLTASQQRSFTDRGFFPRKTLKTEAREYY
jgi:hypothetical protein